MMVEQHRASTQSASRRVDPSRRLHSVRRCGQLAEEIERVRKLERPWKRGEAPLLAQLLDAGAKALRRRRAWPARFRHFGQHWIARGTTFGRVIVQTEAGESVASSEVGRI